MWEYHASLSTESFMKTFRQYAFNFLFVNLSSQNMLPHISKSYKTEVIGALLSEVVKTCCHTLAKVTKLKSSGPYCLKYISNAHCMYIHFNVGFSVGFSVGRAGEGDSRGG